MADPNAVALANIQTSIQQVSALIVLITANPQPSYSVQGVSISWAEYLAQLTEQLNKFMELQVLLSGPYQLVTQAVT